MSGIYQFECKLYYALFIDDEKDKQNNLFNQVFRINLAASRIGQFWWSFWYLTFSYEK